MIAALGICAGAVISADRYPAFPMGVYILGLPLLALGLYRLLWRLVAFRYGGSGIPTPPSGGLVFNLMNGVSKKLF